MRTLRILWANSMKAHCVNQIDAIELWSARLASWKTHAIQLNAAAAEKNFRCDKSLAKNCVRVVMVTKKVLAITGEKLAVPGLPPSASACYRALQFDHHITFCESDAHDGAPDNAGTPPRVRVVFWPIHYSQIHMYKMQFYFQVNN